MTLISRKVTRIGLTLIFANLAGNVIIMASSPVPIIRGADVLDVKTPQVITPNTRDEGARCLFNLAHERGGLGYPKPPQISAKLESGVWDVTMTNDPAYAPYRTPEKKVTVEDRKIVDCINDKRSHRSWRIGMLALAMIGGVMTVAGSIATNNARNNRKSARVPYPMWS